MFITPDKPNGAPMNPELRERYEEQTRKLLSALEKSNEFKKQMEEPSVPVVHSLEELMQSIRDNSVDMTEQEAAKLVKDTKREYDALLKGKNSILDTGGNGKPSATPLFAFTVGVIIGLSALSVIEFVVKPLAVIVIGWPLL